MQLSSLAQLYSSKTDDELLLLASDLHSLVEEARPILAEELRRRNLVILPVPSAVEHQTPNLGHAAVVKFVRTVGTFLLNLANAIFGTALLESSILPHIGFSRSVGEWGLRAWLFSITLAALLGFYTFRRWRPKSAMWVWTLPVPVLAFGALASKGRFAGGDGLWKHLLAPNCVDKESCRDFLIFTIPAARSVAYSAAAWLSFRFQNIPDKSKGPQTG